MEKARNFNAIPQTNQPNIVPNINNYIILLKLIIFKINKII